MNFFNASWLVGLFSLLIPIFLHLQKRKLKTIDWAAVRFLKSSLVSKRRGLTLENFFLLFCRCLLLAAFIFAIARPWTVSGGFFDLGAPWIALSVGLGLIVFSVTWAGARFHRVLIGTFGFSLILLALSVAYQANAESDVGSNCCDAVIVIDGSDSMGISLENGSLNSPTPFSIAIAEAQKFLDQLPAGSAASIVVVGDNDRVMSNRLKSNLPLLRKQLESLVMPGGKNDLTTAIEHARSILKNGNNPRQQILLLTDDQLTNWQSLNASMLSHSGSDASLDADTELDHTPVVQKEQKGDLLAKVINLPEKTSNLAVTEIELEDRVWRAGEKAQLEIEVFNGGTSASENATLELHCNDVLLQTITIEPLAPGSRRAVSAQVDWKDTGSFALRGLIKGDDDLKVDDSLYRATMVQNTIQMLIVDGEESAAEKRNSADFVRLATSGRFVTTTSISIKELESDYPLGQFDIVCLCNVARLEKPTSDSIARFAETGGGVYVLLGERCDPDFYNSWENETSLVMPVALESYRDREQIVEDFVGLNWTSVQHPAFISWLQSGQHDLADWRFNAYWRTTIGDRNKETVLIEKNQIDYHNGDVFFAERNLGQGHVCIQTSCPAPSANNLINRVSFPVWHLILTRHLASKESIGIHQGPTTNWTVHIPVVPDATQWPVVPIPSEFSAVLSNPSGLEKPVTVTRIGAMWHSELGPALLPGLYKLAGPFCGKPNGDSWLLSVSRDASESDLAKATEDQIRDIANSQDIQLLNDDAQLLQAASGNAGREEWWLIFAYGALVFLIAESLVLRWLACQRGQAAIAISIPHIAVIGIVSGVTWWQAWQATSHLFTVQYSNSVAWITCLIAVSSCIVVATYWDRSSSQNAKKLSWVKTARLCELGILGFILLEPLEKRDVASEELGKIAILWDRSSSMMLSENDTTREQIAKKILWGSNDQSSLLESISENHNVQVYQYATSPQLIDFEANSANGVELEPIALAHDSEWRTATHLTDALQRVLADTPDELLSGVIVVSDGCDRSKLPASKIASTFLDRRIPVHAIVIGNREPISDASLVAVNAPNQIYLHDQVSVNTSVKFDRLRGQTATIRLYRNGKLVNTKTIPILSDEQSNAVRFDDTPDEIGMHHYEIRIDPPLQDRVPENNRRELSVWVTNDRLNLLIVEQRPRWEFRYLKNLFAGRDKNVSLQHVLLAPDRLAGVPDPYPMAASASRAFDDCEANRLPESELEWLKFDVIVLGDIQPEELDEQTQRALEKFVNKRGGTLVVICGPNAMPHKYVNRPLYDLLPIQKPTSEPRDSSMPYRLRFTVDGESSTLLSHVLGESATARSIPHSPWDRLPTMHWRHTHAIAKPGATVLAWADELARDDDEDNDELVRERKATATPNREQEESIARKQAIILWHRYGAGRVMQLNFDQTWRLRYWNGDEFHHRFWGKVVRWGTEDRLGLGTELVRLGLDKSRYKVHEPITVKVRLVDDELPRNRSMDELRCSLVRDGETISDCALELVENSGGLFQARFTLPEQPGRYRVQIAGSTIDRLLAMERKGNQAVYADLYVEKDNTDDESRDLVADTSTLAPLVSLTGGLLCDENSADRVSSALSLKRSNISDELTEPVWDSWPIVSLFLSLILFEWIVRKRTGMI